LEVETEVAVFQTQRAKLGRMRMKFQDASKLLSGLERTAALVPVRTMSISIADKAAPGARMIMIIYDCYFSIQNKLKENQISILIFKILYSI
jgi:hypothetical protein